VRRRCDPIRSKRQAQPVATPPSTKRAFLTKRVNYRTRHNCRFTNHTPHDDPMLPPYKPDNFVTFFV